MTHCEETNGLASIFHFRKCYVCDEKKESSIRVRNTHVGQVYMELIVPELFRKSAQS